MEIDDFIARAVLEGELWPAYVVDGGGVLLYANGAWDRTAADAGGPRAAEVIGAHWLDFIRGDEISAFYRTTLERVLTRAAGEGQIVDCNTPTQRRVFFTRFEPLTARGAGAPGAMLVATTLMAAGPIEEVYVTAPRDDVRYLQPSRLLLQCGGCRRVHVSGTVPRVWEFVPEYVAHPRPDVSHGLCELCRELYYGSRLRIAS